MKRLGINHGRYHGETLDVREYLRGFHEAAQARGWVATRFATVGEFALHGYQRGPASAARRIYLSTGIHGDEPAGPVALRRLVEEDRWPKDAEIFLCPCVNPTGLAQNTRENQGGVDLNRDYRDAQSEEVRAQISWLQGLPDLDLTLILHEDWEADGFYIYEVNPDGLPAPGKKILEAVREICPIQPTSLIDGLWECVEGLIHPNVPPADRPLWAEAVFLLAHKTRLSLTLEAPSDFPLELRAAAHVKGVLAALQEP